MGRTLHEVFRIREVRDRRTGGTVVALNPPDTAAMRGGTAVETVLRKSDELADLEAVAQSWFEDGPDIARAIAGVRARNRAKVVTYLLQSVIARHRDKWADLLLRTAFGCARRLSNSNRFFVKKQFWILFPGSAGRDARGGRGLGRETLEPPLST